ncbi:MAG: hypothetical protein IAE83_02935 [Anaerolinea sp.]|nr:hypothetical protein [Anaerolinea sp.]MCC6974809.1 hypothetical protein [Anaerolineae bacterium]
MDGKTSRIYVMNLADSAVTALSPEGVAAYSPSWSPDGKELVFQVGDGGHIYIMNADGSNSHRIGGSIFVSPTLFKRPLNPQRPFEK